MTAPVRLPKRLLGRPRYSDNDEAQRKRARAINKMGEAYKEGKAYNDIDSSKPAEEAFDAAKDYDLLSRVRPSRSLKHTRLPKR